MTVQKVHADRECAAVGAGLDAEGLYVRVCVRVCVHCMYVLDAGGIHRAGACVRLRVCVSVCVVVCGVCVC